MRGKNIYFAFQNIKSLFVTFVVLKAENFKLQFQIESKYKENLLKSQ